MLVAWFLSSNGSRFLGVGMSDTKSGGECFEEWG